MGQNAEMSLKFTDTYLEVQQGSSVKVRALSHSHMAGLDGQTAKGGAANYRQLRSRPLPALVLESLGGVSLQG